MSKPLVDPPDTGKAHAGIRELFFGDLHVHTSLSADAYIMGVRSTPNDAYVFAKGGAIQHSLGYPIRLRQGLDFAAVTDHAEYLGQAALADMPVPSVERSLRAILQEGSRVSITRAWLRTTLFVNNNRLQFDDLDSRINRSAWQQVIDAAERHNEPGVFTTFIGYEWSAWGDSLRIHRHRNVIYRGSNVAEAPFSALDSSRPEDLWAFLDRERQSGRLAMAIPHNSNLSAGGMYPSRDSDGQDFDSKYAERRNRYEPISEIFQIKGQSETHPLLSSDDDFASFELASMKLFGRDTLQDVRGSYARDALRSGIALAQAQGFNPFQFGVIGSSDSHNSSSPVEEDTYHGKLPMLDGTAALRTNAATYVPNRFTPARRWGSGGLAAIWAEENTRAALFDALQRRETYATSGPRIRLRFFAGWDYEPTMLTSPDLIEMADRGGVPMGSTLHHLRGSASPKFLVMATKDPNSANLDRIQIIKGWVDAQGRSFERIIDIAASDDRLPDPDTLRVAPLTSTVNATEASYQNTIGAKHLEVLWEDKNFDPDQPCFYYARVLEIPTPRWSTYDAKRLGQKPMHPTEIQERAVGSAIWFSPDR
ncbi:MAG: DUF3604 domain-containing protein [Pseudomonadota bacterium]